MAQEVSHGTSCNSIRKKFGHPMFQSWRLKLREAEEAVSSGRLDEARRVMVDGRLAEFLPGKRLSDRLAAKLAQRACEHADHGDWDSALKDLAAGEAVGGDADGFREPRQSLSQTAIAHIEQRVCGGDVSGALGLLEKFEKYKLTGTAGQSLREVARRLESARNLSRRGRFADACEQLSAAMAIRSDLPALRRQHDDCKAKGEQLRVLAEQLHKTLGESQWDRCAALADELLALAPEYQVAREAKRRAWAEVGAHLEKSRPNSLPAGLSPANGASGEDDPSQAPARRRLLLWIDGVGGYLTCLSDEVIIGQATPGTGVDIPILADISRRHLRIRRESGSYVVEPLHTTRLEGRSIQSVTPLSDGDEIELGSGVRLRFRQPHALSGTARLEIISRHRTQPYADAILLMAESCVLGPKWQNHVVCRDWAGDVVLYRQDDALFCRAADAIEVDGKLCDGRGRLEANSRVVGADFSLSLEELDRCSIQPLR
jgi:hypothetical protein